MLCFIMALKSKKTSNNWERVSELCERSLQSVYGQTDPEFRVILVCHETPILREKYDHRLETINVDFPLPSKMEAELAMRDKWQKLAVGMVRVGEHKPDFVMIMDADDLVSNKLVAYSKKNPAVNGWILKAGYRYHYGSSWVDREKEKFNCGTNAIINANLIRFPQDTSPEEVSQCILLTAGHTIIENKMSDMGYPLKVLPFFGAIYICSHGDNWTQNHSWRGIKAHLGKLRRTRWLSKKIRNEFSLI